MARVPKTPKPTDPSQERASGPAPKKKKFRIRHQNPAVADFVAKVVLKNAMDMDSAVKEIAPDLSPAKVKEQSELLQNSPTVKAAIEENLTVKGLDSRSKDKYVQKMWDWLEGAESVVYKEDGVTVDEEKTEKKRKSAQEYALTAARILGKGFISEKVNNDKPEELRLSNWDNGIKRMTGENVTALPKATYDA